MNAPENSDASWWRHGYVWLVIAGPLAVVIAGFATLWVAIAIPDPVVAEDYYRRGAELSIKKDVPARALSPALQARNHAATPAPAGGDRP
jgi:uncharacterized protein